MELTHQALRFERLVSNTEEQVTIEGETTLPGSMRDAVTILSVQAQAVLNGMQAGNGEVGVRGKVHFQVLYTQGDLTRIRAVETSCDFDHSVALSGVTPEMRVAAEACVQETEGSAASGRMTLRALLNIYTEAFADETREFVTDALEEGEEPSLQKQMQSVAFCCTQQLGEGQTLVREEFDLPAKLEVENVLSATADAHVDDLTGGSGRVGVSGVIEVRVLHRPLEAGRELVTTVHELPFDLTIEAQLDEGVSPQAMCEVVDVMADSAAQDKRRTLRVEAEVRVKLSACRQQEAQLLEDLYSLTGPELEPVREDVNVHAFEEHAQARESARIQVALPQDAPPIAAMLAAFAQPRLSGLIPAGRRLDAEGIMGVTLIYLPVDSDIPHAVTTKEPFTITFPIEASEGVRGQLQVVECAPGATTSDRAEVRCVLALSTTQHGLRRISGVTDVEQRPETKQEHGFVLVWPAAGESRWDTARRLRVAQESLRPAGKNALLAFRR